MNVSSTHATGVIAICINIVFIIMNFPLLCGVYVGHNNQNYIASLLLIAKSELFLL